MTELEQRLMAALEKLSMQYQQDMNTLNQQVKHLSKQVTTLTNQSNEIAMRFNEAFNRQW